MSTRLGPSHSSAVAPVACLPRRRRGGTAAGAGGRPAAVVVAASIRLSPFVLAPFVGGGAQLPPAACSAVFCSASSTFFGLPPGCTAAPMFCCTATFTLSQAGSLVGACLACGSASRYAFSLGSLLICCSPDLVTGRNPSAEMNFWMFSVL